MDLYHYLKPLISREAIDELKCFLAQKVYKDPDVTKVLPIHLHVLTSQLI